MPSFLELLLSCAEPTKVLLSEETKPLDIIQTDLALNLSTQTGLATIYAITQRPEITLSARNITIRSVRENDVLLAFTQENNWLSFSTAGNKDTAIQIEFDFPERALADFDGWMPAQGISFIWPDHCGNLFPCNPDTQDGMQFSLNISGAPEDKVVIAPTELVSEAPPYMPAFAVGDYRELHVGTTRSGIDVWAWYLDGDDGREDAELGVLNLVESINYLEETYGPYAYGNNIGTVEVDWGADSYGGMEHHPYFHVGKHDFWNEETQIHEVAHGWFGNAVRLECWEDFVLSEGTVTYMTAKTLQEVAGYDLWEYYVTYFLEPICQGQDTNTTVLPDGCNDIDFENDALWSLATYMKGACFYEEVADILGPEILDTIISRFYLEHRYHSAQMEDMLDEIYAGSTVEQRSQIERSVEDWLGTDECPIDYANRCRYRQP